MRIVLVAAGVLLATAITAAASPQVDVLACFGWKHSQDRGFGVSTDISRSPVVKADPPSLPSVQTLPAVAIGDVLDGDAEGSGHVVNRTFYVHAGVSYEQREVAGGGTDDLRVANPRYGPDRACEYP